MGRAKVEVNKALVEKALKEIEANGPLPNQTILFDKIADWYNSATNITGQNKKRVTGAVIRLRVVDEWKMTTKTKPGRRGRQPMTPEQKEAMQQGRGKRSSRAEKFASNPQIVASLKVIQANTPERFLPVAEKLVKGSLSAAIKLKCLDCSDYQTPEIRHCQVKSCPLWAVRPYQ